jgi:hypothetical protein
MEKDRTLIILTNTDAGVSGESIWDFFYDTTTQIPAASINPALGLD